MISRRWFIVPAVTALLANAPAMAQEFVTSTGPLSDDDFYKAVGCGADPGEPWRKPFVKWVVDRPLLVGITRMDRGFLGGRAKRAEAALIRALQFLNKVDMGLRLELAAPGQTPDIPILFLDRPMGHKITDMDGVEGTVMGAATTRIRFNTKGEITRAMIAFSNTLSMRAYESAMLEEITQSLGLITDIRNPHYDPLPIFSQHINAPKRLGAQDKMALIRHYPKP